jgi:uncharacterized caspase-like protein
MPLYGTEVGPLRNPGNDATDIAAALRQLGFEVTLVLDANRQRLEEAVEAFSRQLRRGGVGLFYISGHGAQVEGTNYLIPVGARLAQIHSGRRSLEPLALVRIVL